MIETPISFSETCVNDIKLRDKIVAWIVDPTAPWLL